MPYVDVKSQYTGNYEWVFSLEWKEFDIVISTTSKWKYIWGNLSLNEYIVTWFHCDVFQITEINNMKFTFLEDWSQQKNIEVCIMKLVILWQMEVKCISCIVLIIEFPGYVKNFHEFEIDIRNLQWPRSYYKLFGCLGCSRLSLSAD